MKKVRLLGIFMAVVAVVELVFLGGLQPAEAAKPLKGADYYYK